MPLNKKLHYFFPVLFSFCLPFGSVLLSWIIVAWLITALFNIDKQQLINGLKNIFFWPLPIFFLITVISAALSDTVSERFFAVEVKLSFLIFPFLWFCFEWPLPILRRSVIAFVSGCFFASIYLIGRAFVYSLMGQPEYFFYSLFSGFLHASYFSMYLFLALVFVLVLYPRWFHTQKSLIYSSYFFAAIFITSIFLCASKMGLILLFILLPFLLLYRWRKKMPLRKALLYLTASFVVMLLVLFMLPGSSSRLIRMTQLSIDHIDKTAIESNAVRVLIWDRCIYLVKEKPFFGTGVADANADLYQQYEEMGLTGALSHHFNAHNQYFQTAIGMGLVGFLVLFFVSFGQIYQALKDRRILLLFFSILISINFLVESMLQSAAGVVFFAFFFCFLHLCDQDLLNASPEMNLPNEVGSD